MPRHDRIQQRVGVVGLGLIGASIARALSGIRQVVAWDVDDAVGSQARAIGIDVAAGLDDLVKRVDLIVVAVPMPALSAVFERLSTAMSTSERYPLVTDVASVKLPVLLTAHGALPPQATYVGSHPMAGKQMPGFAASEPELFADAAWPVMIEPRSTLRAIADVCAFVLDCGARPIPMTAGQHDRVAASISHLPHVLATNLLSLVTNSPDADLKLRLAAGSFRDGTRVATDNAPLVAAMCDLNKTHVLQSVDQVIAQLSEFRTILSQSVSGEPIEALVDQAALRRQEILGGGWITQNVSFALDDNLAWRSVLLDAGSIGGHIAGLHEHGNEIRLTLCLPRLS